TSPSITQKNSSSVYSQRNLPGEQRHCPQPNLPSADSTRTAPRLSSCPSRTQSAGIKYSGICSSTCSGALRTAVMGFAPLVNGLVTIEYGVSYEKSYARAV